jgi:hypothetical protein
MMTKSIGLLGSKALATLVNVIVAKAVAPIRLTNSPFVIVIIYLSHTILLLFGVKASRSAFNSRFLSCPSPVSYYPIYIIG